MNINVLAKKHCGSIKKVDYLKRKPTFKNLLNAKETLHRLVYGEFLKGVHMISFIIGFILGACSGFILLALLQANGEH